ncbi:Vam6/Vps39-like protein [Dinochytrium kinnereticum]|nr:Vam6/Vps39-like protein [Dinochytrium kinnereticum]
MNIHIPKSKGATLFAVLESRGPASEPLLCIVVKRKVILFRYGGGTWMEYGELNLPDRAKTLKWIDETRIAFAITKGYYFVNTVTGSVVELLSFGGSLVSTLGGIGGAAKQNRLIITPLDNRQLLLSKDAAGVFVNNDGSPLIERDLEWSGTPEDVYFAPPYVVAMIGSFVEIRSLKSGAIVQKIDLPECRIMASTSFLYIASSSSVWRLLPLDFEDQIEQLISSSRFIEAQRLIEELVFTTEEEKTANIIRVRGLYAHHLFTYQKKYEEAVSMLAELKASPIDVINLYPQFSLLGPSEEVVEDRVALHALLHYLTNQRVILSKLRDFQAPSASKTKPAYSSAESNSSNSIWSGSVDGYPDGYNMRFPSVDDTLYLSEVVDTTLLKVYLAINDALVGPLVRIKNFCNLAECEGILLSHKKYRELTDLYFGKGEHEKALSFLLDRAKADDDNIKPLVAYLMRLDLASNLQRIFTFSEWVLKVKPESGLEIRGGLTERQIPIKIHQDILDFLEKISLRVEAIYLEHMVDEIKIEAPEFHDRLALNYLQTIMRDLVVVGRMDALYEERAILLGRLARHREALGIYIKTLGDLDAAERLRYCDIYDSPALAGLDSVYLVLLDVLLQQLKINSVDETDIVSYLKRYSTKIDPAYAFMMLPSKMNLIDIITFCRSSLQSVLWQKDSTRIQESLAKADHLEAQSKKIELHSRRITVTEDRMCPRCLRRVGNSVFASYPNGAIVHVFCQSREIKGI